MPYIINNRNGDTIVINDGELNQDYSIDLVGRNTENYGRVIASSLIDLLDNFATQSTPPAKATDGQLWYDKAYRQLRVYDATTGSWKPSGILIEGAAPVNDYGQNSVGTAYYNTALGQLLVHDGGGYQLANKPGEVSDAYNTVSALGSPSEYGTTLRNIFLTDTSGVQRAVLAIVYKNDALYSANANDEKIIAILSGHAEFTAADVLSTSGGVEADYYSHLTELNGIGAIIRPGINLRADNNSELERSQHSLRSDVAYNLNEGSYDNDGANIAAATVYHSNKHTVPSSSVTFDLGSSTTVFRNAYVRDVVVGNGATGTIQCTGDVSFGTSSDPVHTLFVNDVHVSGELVTGSGDVDLSTSAVTADSLTANSITVDGYTLPVSAGSNAQQIYLDNNGDAHWANISSAIAAVTVSNGINLVDTAGAVSPVPGSPLTIPQHSIDLALDDQHVRNLFSGGTNISYNSTTGVIANTYSSPFDSFVPANFVQLSTTQTITGDKTFTQPVTVNGGINFGASDATYTGALRFSNGTKYVEIGSDGDLYATGDITAFSDARLKTNLVQIENALNKVEQLTGYVYDRVDTQKRQTGLLAQQVQQVLPEAVSTEQEYLSVNYGAMMGLMVEAIKQLRHEIQELKKDK